MIFFKGHLHKACQLQQALHTYTLERNENANASDTQRTLNMVWMYTRCEHNTNKTLEPYIHMVINLMGW